jgi:hypothetical protein
MRAYMVSVFCECGHAMYQEGRTLVCRFLPCQHYGKLFKAPSVELEPVPEENAPREANLDDQTRP